MITKKILIIISCLLFYSCQSINTLPLGEKKNKLIKFSVTGDVKADTD